MIRKLRDRTLDLVVRVVEVAFGWWYDRVDKTMDRLEGR